VSESKSETSVESAPLDSNMSPGFSGANPVLPALHAFSEKETFRTYRLLILTLLLRPVGNLSLAWGMKHFAKVLAVNPLPYVQAMLSPFVALGIVTLILAQLTRMALLSLADLSFVLPATASGYIFSAMLGRVFLSEHVSSGQWLGTLLIAAGIALVGTTPTRSNAVVLSQ
jgi:drug/metabolite transporter (DMT)-like permease